MENIENGASPILIRTRTAQANAWLKSWNEAASQILLAVLEKNRMSIREAGSGSLLLVIVWGDKTVIVSEVQPRAASYRFVDLPAAFVFLNALLTGLVADLTEPRPVSDRAFSPAFGSL